MLTLTRGSNCHQNDDHHYGDDGDNDDHNHDDDDGDDHDGYAGDNCDDNHVDDWHVLKGVMGFNDANAKKKLAHSDSRE